MNLARIPVETDNIHEIDEGTHWYILQVIEYTIECGGNFNGAIIPYFSLHVWLSIFFLFPSFGEQDFKNLLLKAWSILESVQKGLTKVELREVLLLKKSGGKEKSVLWATVTTQIVNFYCSTTAESSVHKPLSYFLTKCSTTRQADSPAWEFQNQVKTHNNKKNNHHQRTTIWIIKYWGSNAACRPNFTREENRWIRKYK